MSKRSTKKDILWEKNSRKFFWGVRVCKKEDFNTTGDEVPYIGFTSLIQSWKTKGRKTYWDKYES